MAERVTLSTLVGVGTASFALSQDAVLAWGLLLPCGLALFYQIERIPRKVALATRYVCWALLASTIVLGLVFMAYPIFSTETARLLTLLAGYGLAIFSVVFLLGRPAWPPPLTLFPAIFGTLVVAAFNSTPRARGVLELAGVVCFVALALRSEARRTEAPRRPRSDRGLFGLAVSAGGTFLVAWSIIRFLPWAQVQVEQATTSFFSTSTTHYSSLSSEARLGDLAQLKLSKNVVMRVWTSRPQKLRGRVFTLFDGTAWHAREVVTHTLTPAAPAVFSTRSMEEWLGRIPGTIYLLPGHTAKEAEEPGVIRSKVVQNTFNSGMVVSPGEKIAVRVPVSYLALDSAEDLVPPLTSGVEIYGIVNRRKGEIVQTGDESAQILQECLAVPTDTDPRLKALAAQLASGAAAPEERVRRTNDFLQSQCHYSLTVGKFHSRQPVAEFLFEKHQGYCEYFASAAAVLLRLEGVPCRYVTGFNVADGNWTGGHYVVREADAHAWIEAYLSGQGWLEADPTPDAEYQALHADLQGGLWTSITEWVQAEASELYLRVRGGDWRAGARWLWGQLRALLRLIFIEYPARTLLVLALLLLGYVGVRRQRKKPRRRGLTRRSGETAGQIPAELIELLGRLDGLWARQGSARPASRAPLEYLESLERISPELRDAGRAIILSFYRSAFGGASIAPEEIQELHLRLERARVS